MDQRQAPPSADSVPSQGQRGCSGCGRVRSSGLRSGPVRPLCAPPATGQRRPQSQGLLVPVGAFRSIWRQRVRRLSTQFSTQEPAWWGEAFCSGAPTSVPNPHPPTRAVPRALNHARPLDGINPTKTRSYRRACRASARLPQAPGGPSPLNEVRTPAWPSVAVPVARCDQPDWIPSNPAPLEQSRCDGVPSFIWALGTETLRRE